MNASVRTVMIVFNVSSTPFVTLRFVKIVGIGVGGFQCAVFAIFHFVKIARTSSIVKNVKRRNV